MTYSNDDAQLLAMRAAHFAYSRKRRTGDQALKNLMESVLKFAAHYAKSSDIVAKVVSTSAFSSFKTIDLIVDRIDFELLANSDKKDAYKAITECLKDIRKITSLFKDINPDDLQ